MVGFPPPGPLQRRRKERTRITPSRGGAVRYSRNKIDQFRETLQLKSHRLDSSSISLIRFSYALIIPFSMYNKSFPKICKTT